MHVSTTFTARAPNNVVNLDEETRPKEKATSYVRDRYPVCRVTDDATPHGTQQVGSVRKQHMNASDRAAARKTREGVVRGVRGGGGGASASIGALVG